MTMRAYRIDTKAGAWSRTTNGRLRKGAPSRRRLKRPLRLFEIARVLVRFDHVASIIINANHGTMGSAAKLGVVNCVADCVRPTIPEPTECLRQTLTAFVPYFQRVHSSGS
jgi:hypothetical protein